MTLIGVLVLVCIIAILAWSIDRYASPPYGRVVALILIVLLALFLLLLWVHTGARGLRAIGG